MVEFNDTEQLKILRSHVSMTYQNILDKMSFLKSRMTNLNEKIKLYRSKGIDTRDEDKEYNYMIGQMDLLIDIKHDFLMFLMGK